MAKLASACLPVCAAVARLAALPLLPIRAWLKLKPGSCVAETIVCC